MNVAAETLYSEAITVKRGLICRQVFDEVEYEQKVNVIELDENISEKEGFELEEI